MLFHKTTLRERYDAARERFPDADDVVLVNTRGRGDRDDPREHRRADATDDG